jgi:Peptidase family M23
VLAPVSGTLRMVGFSNYSGNKVTIEDSCGWSYSMFHLQRIEPGIEDGLRVEAGQVVGYVGKTGTASNGVVHLHISMFPDRNYNAGIDPWPALHRIEADTCATPLPPPVADLSFDANVYLALNPDVAAARGRDAEVARAHWIEFGLKEGRTASIVFSTNHYLASNADLVQVFGRSNFVAALGHYTEFNITEGRETSPVFSARHYLALYPDLQAAFGADYAAAARHFLEFGIDEGRSASPHFSAINYLNRYADLRQAFGPTNYRAAVMHYLEFGMSEGRDGR